MKIAQYFRELKQEMTHVIWPKRNTAVAFTAIVILASLLIAYFLGAFDKLFSVGLEKFLIK
ncbi:preprotein translocase subunit SecE [Candidatus Nomurabacteria bacterium RIFCSPHIGHO2_01_FULL_39_9]|uniref:Preprotein translocase subunit SecE n=1 Tax=Candidatus Nomurabacteria bacterium RIFCSPHIGHO2_01_FULL_39_9 TaxID=1801735 RepID=A0A1F6UY63_9BACT|nr:MAG: preprotein translocase subunit SecE [Candidatus Nomurabacteria bacterium RIFCSPHIGHO2_01_FULL_39_9]